MGANDTDGGRVRERAFPSRAIPFPSDVFVPRFLFLRGNRLAPLLAGGSIQDLSPSIEAFDAKSSRATKPEYIEQLLGRFWSLPPHLFRSPWSAPNLPNFRGSDSVSPRTSFTV